MLFTTASSAPSPLYVVYQHNWAFSPTTLTIVFAVYVFGLLASLLILGGLSDHVGRRPVLLAAIGVESLSLVLFLIADNVVALMVARTVQGLATGAAMATAGATLVDFNPPHAPGRAGVVNSVAPISGLALGALGTGALVQFAPAPTHLIYALLLGAMTLAALAVFAAPETSAPRPGAVASLVPKLGVPPRLRRDLLALLPILIASWALGGLYLSLGPSVAASLFGLTNHFIGGLVVTLLCGTGAVTAFLLRATQGNRVLAIGSSLLFVGTVVSLVGVETSHVALAAAGTAIAGVGFGAAALACFGTLARLATPTERGRLFATAYVLAYLAFSIPAVAAGFAATSVGLHPTTDVYCLVVIAMSLAALFTQRLLHTPASSEAS
ncbi:MFS transporter [Streptomyces sp. NPDC051664]|uniref:MFS transporter n=1 Tax=Streptomyces sp. NPDC051664 TaxID=3365668 RepID=UPI0037ACA4AC